MTGKISTHVYRDVKMKYLRSSCSRALLYFVLFIGMKIVILADLHDVYSGLWSLDLINN